MKAHARQTQRELSFAQMVKAVLTADVVVTDQTEIAVALKYDPEEMKAPCVVAKGKKPITQKIRELAGEHRIPMVENRSVARALFKMCDAGQMIPRNLYGAVVEVLACVYRLKERV